MDAPVRMDTGRGRRISGVLPPAFEGTFDTQRAPSRVLPVTTEERIAAMEATLNQLFDFTKKSHDRMDKFGDKLEIVARLEERWQSLDQRVIVMSSSFESELSRRNRIDENLFDRVRSIENQTGVNTNRSNTFEKYLIPLVTASVTATLTYFAVILVNQVQ